MAGGALRASAEISVGSTFIAINCFDIRDRESGLSVEDQVVGVIGRVLELGARKDFVIDDDEIDGTVFTTVGSLTDFVQAKLAV